MKILMLCADWGVSLRGDAGSSVHLREMASAFQSLGHEVRFLVANDGGRNPLDLSVKSVPVRLYSNGLRKTVDSLRGQREASSSPGPENPLDTQPSVGESSCDTPSPPSSPAPNSLSWKAKFYYQTLPSFLDKWEELLFYRYRFASAVSKAVSEWNPDFIYERYALGQTGGGVSARQNGIPHVLEINAPLVDERVSKYGLPKLLEITGRADERRIWAGADQRFCVSDELRHRVISTGAKGEGTSTLSNGVNCDVFNSREDKEPRGRLRELVCGKEARGEAILIGWLGSLSAGRGAEEFLRMLPSVLNEVPEALGVVIGGGPLMGEYRALCERLSIADRVTFAGSVPHGEVPELLPDLDLAVASYPPQKDFYFSPMKVYEYMACGLPVVAGAMGQMKEIIVDGENGLLLPPESQDAWSKALIELCLDREKRVEMGRAARESMVKKHSWQSNAETVVAAAKRVIETRNLARR